MPSRGILQNATRRTIRGVRFAARYATAGARPLPDFVILGTQRGGTTSLYNWLVSHPDVTPAFKKEPHYFDGNYHRGARWYRAHFPIGRRGRMTGESSPFLLFHPLAPERAARDLPSRTRFLVLLRDPTERAISQYWLWRKQGNWEEETLERAIELEQERLAPMEERFRNGERSHPHVAHSYLARGEYAEQLQRWFDAVGRERILVVESEQLFSDPEAARQILNWLGLPPTAQPFPMANGAPRLAPAPPALIERMDAHFLPHKGALANLLGRELWTTTPPRRTSGPGHEPDGGGPGTGD